MGMTVIFNDKGQWHTQEYADGNLTWGQRRSFPHILFVPLDEDLTESKIFDTVQDAVSTILNEGENDEN